MKWALAGLSFLCVVAMCAADDKWMKIEPKDAGCEIQFPGKPSEVMKDRTWQYDLRPAGGKTQYIFAINELVGNKAAIDQADAVKKIFDRGQQALLESKELEGNKLVKAEDGMFGKYPTREIELSVPKIGTYRVKFILTT